MSHLTVRRLAHVALTLLIVIGAALSEAPPGVVVALAVLALLATALLLPRPGWPAISGALLAGGAVTGLCTGTASNVGWFAICLLVGGAALYDGTAPALALAAAATGVFVVEATVLSSDPGWLAWIAGTALSLVVCLMARRQQELIEQLREAQAGLSERVRAEERNRVARELHDVIAHSLTVSLLHVSSARLAVDDDDPGEAARSLARAEELGRQSLDEVRHAVGLLREGTTSRAPLPGAAQLPDLVDGFRQAGTQVAYDVVGDPARLPATTGLTVYRILQESLTNSVRHGGGAETTVRLEVGRRSVVLTVDNTGAPSRRNGAGVGLHSMRERAEALGGELSAGPSESGWRVQAVLPS